jgi:hypothetical protein
MHWYQSLSRGKQIAVFVVAAHGFMLCMLGGDHWMHRANGNRKKITVHTILCSPPKVAAKTKLSPKTQPASKTQKLVAKQPLPKEPPAKLAAPMVAPAPLDSDALLAKIENNLDLLAENTSVVKKSTITIPDFTFRPTEYSAAEQIVSLLQASLELPEFGSVKVQLSINAVGILEEVAILEAKSQKNAEFLKKQLPELQFPCLNKDTTLTIIFSNAP